MLPSPPRPQSESERREPLRPGPLSGRYAPTAAMVVLFLVPYLGLSGALQPLTPIIATQYSVRCAAYGARRASASARGLPAAMSARSRRTAAAAEKPTTPVRRPSRA